MGDSSDEIDREIRETRRQLDQNLGILEQRAASGARRYGRIAAGVGVGVAALVIGAVVYRRYRRRSVVKQLREALLQSVRDLPDEVTSRLKRRLPIKVVVTDRANEESTPSAWASIARKVAPAVAGSAASAVVSRVVHGTPQTPTTAE
jgi:hypothetical protein